MTLLMIEATGSSYRLPEKGLVGTHAIFDPAILDTPVSAIMTRDPVTIEPHKLADAALELMNRRRITVIFAVADGRPAGIVHVHDLLRAGIA